MSKLKSVLKNLAFILIVLSIVEAFKTRNMPRDIGPILAKYNKVPLLEKGFIDLAKDTGREKVFYFFAPWCPVCKEVSSNFDWVKDEADVIYVALNWASVKNVETFIKENSDGSYPVVLGSDVMASDFKVASFPSFYFVGKDGKYSSSATSYLTHFGIWWRVKMSQLF